MFLVCGKYVSSLTLSLMAKVIYGLAFSMENYSKNFKYNKSETFNIPGAMSCKSVLLKVFFNSIMLFWLITEIVQLTKKVRSHITLGPLSVLILPLKKWNIVLTSHCLQSIWPQPVQVKRDGRGNVKYKNCVIYQSKIA